MGSGWDTPLQITLPAVLLSTALGLLWGLHCGYKKGGVLDKLSTTFQIVVNTMPSFVIALVLMILFCFRQRWFPYTGLNSAGVSPERLHICGIGYAT